MEVKNPLFMDDPTPATPAASAAAGAQPTIQPKQTQPSQKPVESAKKTSPPPTKKGQPKNKPKK